MYSVRAYSSEHRKIDITHAPYNGLCMEVEDKLYHELFDMILLLRDVAFEFKCYSANDIKKLIASKMKAVREVKALKQLYQLEEAIGALRSSFSAAKAAAPIPKEQACELQSR